MNAVLAIYKFLILEIWFRRMHIYIQIVNCWQLLTYRERETKHFFLEKESRQP